MKKILCLFAFMATSSGFADVKSKVLIAGKSEVINCNAVLRQENPKIEGTDFVCEVFDNGKLIGTKRAGQRDSLADVCHCQPKKGMLVVSYNELTSDSKNRYEKNLPKIKPKVDGKEGSSFSCNTKLSSVKVEDKDQNTCSIFSVKDQQEVVVAKKVSKDTILDCSCGDVKDLKSKGLGFILTEDGQKLLRGSTTPSETTSVPKVVEPQKGQMVFTEDKLDAKKPSEGEVQIDSPSPTTTDTEKDQHLCVIKSKAKAFDKKKNKYVWFCQIEYEDNISQVLDKKFDNEHGCAEACEDFVNNKDLCSTPDELPGDEKYEAPPVGKAKKVKKK